MSTATRQAPPRGLFHTEMKCPYDGGRLRSGGACSSQGPVVYPRSPATETSAYAGSHASFAAEGGCAPNALRPLVAVGLKTMPSAARYSRNAGLMPWRTDVAANARSAAASESSAASRAAAGRVVTASSATHASAGRRRAIGVMGVSLWLQSWHHGSAQPPRGEPEHHEPADTPRTNHEFRRRPA